MPGNFKKEDLRIVKTKKALMDAMFRLLEARSFSQITVNDLCLEAQISRATFYAHFVDKYDLLKHWLESVKPLLFIKNSTYEELAQSVNCFLNNHMKLIRNLLEDANDETFELLCCFMFSLLDIDVDNADGRGLVLAKFCSGGMFNYLLWQAKNKRPLDFQVLNRYFYDILMLLQKWYSEA